MKKIVFIILFSLVSFSVYAKDQPCSNKEINPDVQLQDNGWLKIVDQYVKEFTPEEFYKGNELMIKSHKNAVQMGLEREKIRELNVKIQFLKPCIATTEMEEWVEKQNPSKDPNTLIPLTGEKGECVLLFMASTEAYQQGNKDKYKQIIDKIIKQCPDSMEYITPRFRCDYRLKVFFTYFTPSQFKEYTSDTFSYFPEAPIIDVRENRINRKTEVLPGETMWIKFYITGTATSWCVWVPK